MLVIFAVIIGGIITGRLLSSWRLVFVSRMITVIIWLLLFLLGLEVGSDPAVVGGMATLGRTAFVIFACSVAGSICMSWLLWRCVRRGTASRPPAEGMPEQAGAALSTLLLPPLTAGDTMAVGAGFGYYSLSSIFIADFRGAELGTVALLCNVMRELFTLLAAPLVARWFGPLAAVSIGGATTFDTTLPIITQSAGKPYAVVSVFHGCVLDFSVPFLVTFFCTM